MTKVSFEPYQRITIRSHMRYASPQSFADALTLSLARGIGGRGGNLFWASGVMFRHYPYASSDAVSKEYLTGHLPIDHVEFAPMPIYINEIRSGEIIVTILDVSDHTVLGSIGKWIADNLLKNQKKR